jgi:hypothetical protein
MRSRARSPPARARCWSSTRPRASRRRRWPTSIRRSTPTTRSCRSSTRSTCPPPSPTGSSSRSRTSSASTRRRRADLGQDRHRHRGRAGGHRHRLPPPKGDRDAPLKALLVDSWYDAYLGVVVLVRVIDGVLKKGQKIRMMGTGRGLQVDDRRLPPKKADPSSARARSASSPPRSSRWPTPASATPSPTTEEGRHRGPAGLQAGAAGGVLRPVPVDAADFEDLRAAMGKLRLNDASFSYEMETSARAGLRLPLRLPRPAAPGDHPGAAGARVRPRPDHHRAQRRLPDHMRDGTHEGAAQPGRHARSVMKIDHIEEPWIKATILVPDEYLGSSEAVPGPPRRAVELTYVGKRAMAGLRPAAQRGGVRLLRPLKSSRRAMPASTTRSTGYARATS